MKSAITKTKQHTMNQVAFYQIPLRHIFNMSLIDANEVQVSSLSNFGDNQWDFSAQDPSRPRYEQLLTFEALFPLNWNFQSAVSNTLIFSLKCLAYSLITDPPTPRHTIPGVIKGFKRGGIKNLITFMTTESFCCFAQLTQVDFERFLKEQILAKETTKECTDRNLRARIRGIEWILLQSEKLQDKLTFDPWKDFGTHGRWALANADRIVSRNQLTTPVIPDSVVKVLIEYSIKTIGEASRLINAMTLLEESKRIGDGLNPSKKISPISRTRDLKPYLPSNLSDYGFKNASDVRLFYCVFRGAVSVLIGLLSGMRPSEIFNISGNITQAFKVESIEINGLEIKCQFLKSTLQKARFSAEYQVWQTIPEVISAIKALAVVNETCFNSESPWLFRAIKNRIRSGNNLNSRRLPAQVLSKDIQRLIDYYQLDAQGWKTSLNARMLRRTFARIITRNGLGIVELQDQLKHYDPDITRMYGEAKLGENLDNEKTIYTEELYEELLGGTFPIIGGGALAVEALRKEFQGLTRPNRRRFLHSLPKSALIDQVDLGLCMYKPEQALCGGNKINCRPAECLNSVIPLDSTVKSLRNRKTENTRLIKFLKQPAKQSYLLKQQRTIDLLLDQAEQKILREENTSD